MSLNSFPQEPRKFSFINFLSCAILGITVSFLYKNSAFAQSTASVSPDLAVIIPVTQVGSEFYDLRLEAVGEDWIVTAADLVTNPSSIAATFSNSVLNIMCLDFEGATYEIQLTLKDLSTATFELTSIADVSMSSDCSSGFNVGAAGHGSALSFQKIAITDALNREALCNDGSAAVFYYRAAQSPSPNWLIHLQGGGDCSDEDTCMLRAQVTANDVAEPENFLPFTSSNSYPDTLERDGILSRNLLINPQFGTYNQVYIPYCSSDSHYGDRSASSDTFNFNFKGAKIIQSIIEDLISAQSFASNSLADSELVLVTGTSAGGRGVQQNLDRIAALIPHENIFGVMDSSYFDRYFLTDEERIGLSLRQSNLWNGQYDDSCVSLAGEDDKHLCDRVELMDSYLATPYFLHMDQLDETAIGDNTAQSDEFASHIRTTLEDQCGLFSGQFGYHGTLDNDIRFFESLIGEYNIHDVLVNWLTGTDNSVKTVVAGGNVSSCE